MARCSAAAKTWDGRPCQAYPDTPDRRAGVSGYGARCAPEIRFGRRNQLTGKPMFAIENLAIAEQLLSHVYSARINQETDAEPITSVRGAAGIFLVRDDGANGGKLAKEVVSSFRYWDARTGHHFDGVFLGWGFDEYPAYLNDGFLTSVANLEKALDWHYDGGAHLFLADFVYSPAERHGALDFSSSVHLDLSKLLEEKKYAQLSPLIEEIVRPLRASPRDDSSSPTWRVSDYIAVLRTRKFMWQELIKRVGALLGWADDVSNFAVRDLRRKV